MLLALIGAILAAVCYGVATVLEAIAVAKMSALPPTSPLSSRIREGWLFAVGLVIDGLGFILSAAALHSLPLFLVESVVASSVAVTALLAVVWLHQKLNRTEVFALVILVIGLISLGLTAKDGSAVTAPSFASWAILLATIPLAGTAALLVMQRPGAHSDSGNLPNHVEPNSSRDSTSHRKFSRANGVALATIAGLSFGMVGIAARLIPAHSRWTDYSLDSLVWAVIGYGALAAIGFTLALGACIALSARSEVEV